MIHARRSHLAPPGATEVRTALPGIPVPNGSSGDKMSGSQPESGSATRPHSWVRAAGRGLAAVLYPCTQILMEAVVRVYFRRLETISRDRFPAHGAVLVVANHPAAWTDVLVLDVAFHRELHFLAHEALFHPWIRGLFLKLFESLPVRYRHEGPLAAVRNRETFDRCHTLFRRGAAIAMFPEGMSGSDRGLRPLKTGAARLVLEHIAAGDEAPVLIPVAIHYEDRTRFRARVDVAVGAPILNAGAGVSAGDPDAAMHALTGEISNALEATLASAAAHARVADEALRAVAPPPAYIRSAAALASIAATAGAALHAVPVRAIEWVARRLTGLPQRISFGRILAGVVLIPLWYAALVTLAAALGGGVWFAIPSAAPFLGVLACREFDRRRAQAAATRAPIDGESA